MSDNREYQEGYDAGYAVGYADGNSDREMRECKVAPSREWQLRLALDQHFKPVYQGTNTLCAQCGQPIVGTPVQDQDDKGNTYLYCSDRCWQLHGWG